jgi:class 3 adenylate cyclase
MQLIKRFGVSIKTKLIVMLLLVSICSMWTSTFICSKTGEAILTRKVFDQLTSLRSAKTYQIQDYFENLVDHTQTLSNDLMFVNAVREFQAAYEETVKINVPPEFDQKIDSFYNQEFLPKLAKTVEGTPLAAVYTPKTTVARYLQYHYIAANSQPLGKKHLLDNPGDASKYSIVHARYNPIFRNIAQKFDYSDMYLIDNKGEIIYSLSKEVDFATNLTLGPYKESNLAQAFNDCRRANSSNFVEIVDFQPYKPSYGAPVAFVAAPIISGTNLIGVLVFKLPVDQINRIMTGNKNWKENGLGDSGETYLVGRDYLMRSISRFFVEDSKGYEQVQNSIGADKNLLKKINEYNTTILLQEVRTKATEAAYFGKTATQIVNDYRNIPVLSSYAPLEIKGLRWMILAEIDVAEAYAPIYEFEKQVLIATTLIMIIITLVAMWLAKIFVKPINSLISSARRVGAGEVNAIVTSKSNDEFGELAKSFNETIFTLRTQAEMVEQENRENEKLVLSIVPPSIAHRIKHGEKNIVEQVSNVTVFFSDLHRFTRLSRTKTPQEVVILLNELVTAFDEIAEKYGIEKIKTLGDGYMAICGLSTPRLDHDKRMVDFALEMLGFVRRFNYERDLQLDLRIGINSGDVIAGIIGKNKLLYDIWGDTVNVANRMKSACQPGVILVPQNVCDRLRDLYEFELVGEIQEPGKEKLIAWQILGNQQSINTKGWKTDD